MSEEEYLDLLQKTYAFSIMYYSMSFRDRIRFKLGTLRVSTSPNDVIRSWSKEELEKKLGELKKPWWDWIFSF